MHTALIEHPDCERHEMFAGHPEEPARIAAIRDHLLATGLYDLLQLHEAPRATDAQLLRVHAPEHLASLAALSPATGLAVVDPDTAMNPESLEAARRAAGAVTHAVDLVMAGSARNAFCLVRPPGHHAEPRRAMGFCLFNNVAVGAAHALAAHGLQRIAILDFDAHQGNGTVKAFAGDRRVLVCSTFQHPFYPGTDHDDSHDNVVNCRLPAGAGGAEFRAAVRNRWLPALERFAPELLFVSAGFDAHASDDLAQLELHAADFGWVTERLRDVAAASAQGRIVSVLEGGYDLHALARCAAAHVRVLLGV